MADVFLSYKREDLSMAERLFAALREEGLSVWWDDRLTPQNSWDATIEGEIAAASTVVVLWTPRSVSSEWVRTEAHYAQERGKLVPVLLEECAVPIAFLLRQTIQLKGWNGDTTSREWRKLLTWIGDLKTRKPGGAGELNEAGAAKGNPFRNTIGTLPSGDPVVDGAFVNAATPAGTAFRDGNNRPVMRVISSGAFLLGSPFTDPDRTAVEGPQRRIEIPAPFAMSVFPVLATDYREVMGQAPAPVSIDAKPVASVSFDDAQTFIEKLANSTGESYRMPSETEWEYACRAGSRTRYSCGDQIDSTLAMFGAAVGPIAAGTFRPNAFGLYDMHGNVREWTADLWHESYDFTPLDGTPALDGHGSMRVVRGGGWCDDATLLRSAARMRATQSVRSQYIGLRIVRALG